MGIGEVVRSLKLTCFVVLFLIAPAYYLEGQETEWTISNRVDQISGEVSYYARSPLARSHGIESFVSFVCSGKHGEVYIASTARSEFGGMRGFWGSSGPSGADDPTAPGSGLPTGGDESGRPARGIAEARERCRKASLPISTPHLPEARRPRQAQPDRTPPMTRIPLVPDLPPLPSEAADKALCQSEIGAWARARNLK